ncbi:tyrosine-type recombinase/integrase [Streptomyces sp. 4N124]|uniref:tyrosine-type recombinase/integrase n=1 Tax=Streptomyces sp. 4N124 TaxID=3457420 RepID=UPI003FD3ED8E
MAVIHDAWHSKTGAAQCREHKKPPSKAHGYGLRWQVRWRDANGVQQKRSYAKKGDAEDKKKAVESALIRGQLTDPKVTFKEYAEKWRASQPHRPTTVEVVGNSFEKHAYPAFGSRRLISITQSDIQSWAVSLPVAPSTARRILSNVGPVFSAAVRDGIIGRSPCQGIRLPQPPHREIVPTSASQVRALAASLPARLALLPVLLAGTGVRPGECFGLRVADVDSVTRTVTVRQQRQGGVDAPLKTARSHRVIPVPKSLLDAVAAHVEVFPSKDGYVFSDAKGQPLDEHRFRHVWHRAVKAAGLPKGTRIHDLRHTYASALIAAGATPVTVARRLGDSVITTMRVYAHCWPTDDDQTRLAVDAFLSAPQVP